MLLAGPRPSRERYSRPCRALSPQPCAPGRLCSPPCIVIVSLPVRSLSLSLSLSPLFVSPADSSLCLFLTHGPPRLPELSRCDCALIHAPRRFSASLRDVIAPHHRRQSSARPIAVHQPVHTHGHWWGYRRKVVRLTGTYLLRVRIKRTVTSEVSVNLPTSNECAAFAEPPTKGLTVPAFKPSFSGCHMIIHRLVVPYGYHRAVLAVYTCKPFAAR